MLYRITSPAFFFAFYCAVLAQASKTHSGDATFYTPGPGNCGGYNNENESVAALSQKEYQSKDHCNEKIMVHYQGKSVIATVVDSCVSCKRYDIDLSPAAFAQLASKDLGRIQVTWEYIGR